jgi:hypothetical protein
MWPEIQRYLREYPSAVLSGIDSSGYPFSIRCQPLPDQTEEVLRIARLPTVDLAEGPASLLCHSHNLFLWKLRSFVVRGSLEVADGSYLFRPARFVPGIGVGGVPGMIRFATSKRQAANRYLSHRNLARPTIPWQRLKAIQREVRRSRLRA